MMRVIAILLAVAALSAPARAAPAKLPADPLGSPMWEHHAKRLFGTARVVFDDRIKVILPELAENQHAVPVTVDARLVPQVVRVVLFEDLNPIPDSVVFVPHSAAAYFSTRIKLDQRTPIRAAALTADGTWHVAGGWLDAAGGGCSAPPVSRVKGDWAEHLGELRGAAWAEGSETRLRIGVRHPMDTGLVENIPAYNIEDIAVRDDTGAVLAELTIGGSVAEDPAFTLLVEPASAGPLAIAARDSNGREFAGRIARASGSALAAARR